MPRVHAVLAAISAAVLIAVIAIASTADWYLTCTDDAGNELGGMDCFNTTPKTHRAIAGWLGWDALVITGGLATVTIAVVVAIWLWRWWHDVTGPQGTSETG